jgi:hypothetical protein
MENNIFLKLTCLLVLIAPTMLFAQTHYLVSVNPTNGAHTIISSIRNVQFINCGRSTFDGVNGRFIFVGADINRNDTLYSIEVTTGTIVARAPFPVGLGINDNLSSLIFNNSDSTLYALLYQGNSQLNYLVSLNPNTGVHSIIDSIPGFQSILSGSQVLDEVNQTYSFVGLNQILFTSKLYTVDLLTGAILHSPSFPNLTNQLDGIFNLKQDSANNLLGIYNSFNSNTHELISIDKVTGVHTFIDTLNGFTNYIPFNSVYNSSLKTYSFKGLDQNSNERYFNYNARNGNLISNPLYPVLSDTNDHISELHIDHSTGTIYGILWDNNITTGLAEKIVDKQLQVYPNPASTEINITVGDEKQFRIDLFNNLGQLVLSELRNVNSKIDIEEFDSGLYYIRITTSQWSVTKKVIVN